MLPPAIRELDGGLSGGLVRQNGSVNRVGRRERAFQLRRSICGTPAAELLLQKGFSVWFWAIKTSVVWTVKKQARHKHLGRLESSAEQGRGARRSAAREGGGTAPRRSGCHSSSGRGSAVEAMERFDKSLDILARWEIKMEKKKKVQEGSS